MLQAFAPRNLAVCALFYYRFHCVHEIDCDGVCAGPKVAAYAAGSGVGGILLVVLGIVVVRKKCSRGNGNADVRGMEAAENLSGTADGSSAPLLRGHAVATGHSQHVVTDGKRKQEIEEISSSYKSSDKETSMDEELRGFQVPYSCLKRRAV